MLQKRYGTDEDRDGSGDGGAAAEATRAAQPPATRPDGDERVSLFWRVFGGTILSMVALGALTLYNGVTANITDLRNELNREREARAELVRKDEFNARTGTQYERIRSLDGLRADHEGLRERVNAAAAAVDGLRKDAEATRKDVAGVETLRERVAAAVGDLKTAREDVAKIVQEQDRNRAADLERKSHRDGQYKQVDEALKELQKGLQDCREKLARLEGGMPRGAFAPAETKGGPERPAP